MTGDSFNLAIQNAKTLDRLNVIYICFIFKKDVIAGADRYSGIGKYSLKVDPWSGSLSAMIQPE